MKTLFTDGIEFLNNIGDTCKALNNAEENNVDSLKLIEAVVIKNIENREHIYRCRIFSKNMFFEFFL